MNSECEVIAPIITPVFSNKGIITRIQETEAYISVFSTQKHRPKSFLATFP